jgi:hypothetical protein
MLMTLNILLSGFGLVRQSVAGVLDEADPAVRAEIERILTDETERRGIRYHEVRRRPRLAGILRCLAERDASGREIQPLSVYLDALGMTDMIAWVGLILVEVKARDVVFIREPPVRSEVWPGSWRNRAGAVPSGQPVRRKRCSF